MVDGTTGQDCLSDDVIENILGCVELNSIPCC